LESDKLVDVVVGPDAYRDLPRLIGAVEAGAAPGEQTINVQLSLEETYADITPVRLDSNGVSAYVSIMRGCDNMCSFCIVPFTRGRERSRDPDTIVREIQQLVDSGYSEVTLLGQNVNSYNYHPPEDERVKLQTSRDALSRGFQNISRRPVAGVMFSQLVERIAATFPELRVRFTSPHPKDFPDDLLALFSQYPNLCRLLHLPAQSGSSETLKRMRRGYTREAYLALVEHIRTLVPRMAFSTDLISGFCGESEADHTATLELLRAVRFDQAFTFAYSQREKTHAHRNYVDDVPSDVKGRRLREVIDLFQTLAVERSRELADSVQLVLVEGFNSSGRMHGKIESGRRV
jgi:MiaB/RimO family radical SAM methylthiotransferase